LNETWQDHVTFYNSHTGKYRLKGKTHTAHLSRYFGDRSWVKGDEVVINEQGRTLHPLGPYLSAHGFDPAIQSEMNHISCINLSRNCLSEAFHAAGQDDFWKKIDDYNMAHHNSGPYILVGLQALGWKIMYWNPDPSRNADWDKWDHERYPTNKQKEWGDHSYIYNVQIPQHKYMTFDVDDTTTLVGFKTSPPKAFTSQPFFIGIANGGYHVFVGSLGNVIEAHSARDPLGFDNLQNTPFNPIKIGMNPPMTKEPIEGGGGAPLSTDDEHYRSGMLAVPPSAP
jgi:hypothetical protein